MFSHYKTKYSYHDGEGGKKGTFVKCKSNSKGEMLEISVAHQARSHTRGSLTCSELWQVPSRSFNSQKRCQPQEPKGGFAGNSLSAQQLTNTSLHNPSPLPTEEQGLTCHAALLALRHLLFDGKVNTAAWPQKSLRYKKPH